MKTTKCPQDKPKVENEWPKRKFKHTPKNVDLEKAKKKKKKYKWDVFLLEDL